MWLGAVCDKSASVRRFRRNTQDEKIKKFIELDDLQLLIAQMRIREKLIENLPSTHRMLNGIRYVKLKHSNDLIKTAQSIKEAFRKCHTFFATNDEEDIEILRTRFQNWRKQK